MRISSNNYFILQNIILRNTLTGVIIPRVKYIVNNLILQNIYFDYDRFL